MKLFQRRTALIVISLLIIQLTTSAFVFADDTASVSEEATLEASQADDTLSVAPEENNDGDASATMDDTGKQPETKSEQSSLKSEQGAGAGEQNPSDSEQESSDTDQDKDDGKEEPAPLNGWIKSKGKTYYYINGKKQTGMKHIGKYWYFFKATGVMKTGWLTKDGNRYYFDPSDGRRVHGKKSIKSKVYYFRKSGIMVKGWLKSKGKKYYHNPSNGKRMFGSRKIGKYHYYFKPKSGIMKKGWLKLKGKYYYYDKKGHKLYGIQKIGKKTYYLNRTTGAKTSKGNYYLYNKIWSKSSSTNWLIYVSKGGRWVNVFKGKKNDWTLIKRCRCSIGAPSTPTPSGTYKVTCKVYHFGESKGYTCWYATGFIGSTYLMHSVVCYSGTKTPSDGRLGMAISHGCVRMATGNAKWIYDHVPGGSTVYIS